MKSWFWLLAGLLAIPSLPSPAQDTPAREEVEAFLGTWERAWESRNLASYEALYAGDFVGVNYSLAKGARTLSRADWMADKAAKFSGSGNISIGIEAVEYAMDGANLAVRFTQLYRSGSYEDRGTKLLVLRRTGGGGAWLITREQFVPPEALAAHGSAFEAPASSDDESLVPAEIRRALAEFVGGWESAWESRDLPGYRAYYAPAFVGTNYSASSGSKTLDHSGWMADKARKFSGSGGISIEVGPLSVTRSGSSYIVAFPQTYRSGVYSDHGTKTLVVQPNGIGGWSITSEYFGQDQGQGLAARPGSAQRLTLGQNTISVTRYASPQGAHGPAFVSVHSNERGSLALAMDWLATNAGELIALEGGGERRLTLSPGSRSYTIDPNRMFSATGIERDMKKFGFYRPELGSAVSAFAKDWLALAKLEERPAVVALHNNTDGPPLSVATFLPGGGEAGNVVKVSPGNRPGWDSDDFFLVTDPSAYAHFAAAGFPVVLQDNERVQDDGSLSVWCGKRGIPYVNVEVQFGHDEAAYLMMQEVGRWLEGR